MSPDQVSALVRDPRMAELAGRDGLTWGAVRLTLAVWRDGKVTEGDAREVIGVYNAWRKEVLAMGDENPHKRQYVQVRVTDAEKVAYQVAAGRAGVSVSSWVRGVLGPVVREG